MLYRKLRWLPTLELGEDELLSCRPQLGWQPMTRVEEKAEDGEEVELGVEAEARGTSNLR